MTLQVKEIQTKVLRLFEIQVPYHSAVLVFRKLEHIFIKQHGLLYDEALKTYLDYLAQAHD